MNIHNGAIPQLQRMLNAEYAKVVQPIIGVPVVVSGHMQKDSIQ